MVGDHVQHRLRHQARAGVVQMHPGGAPRSVGAPPGEIGRSGDLRGLAGIGLGAGTCFVGVFETVAVRVAKRPERHANIVLEPVLVGLAKVGG